MRINSIFLGEKMNINIPRKEHPKPQFERQDWLNLNGEWQFEIDNGRSGAARGLYQTQCRLTGKILVPFCPESKLSGIQHKDFMYGVWYKREVEIPESKLYGRTMLHFGAVDYECTVYVNGTLAGQHKGGYVSFAFDITNYVTAGNNQITVYAVDDTRDPMIPRGKQSEEYNSHGCDYTRTTGLWQTVWLEFKPDTFVERVRYFPDSARACLTLQAWLKGSADFTIRAYYKGKQVGIKQLTNCAGMTTVELPLTEKHLWEVGHGRLFQLELEFGEDKVKSYFGLRNIRLDGMRFLINEKSVFQRLILDQGFYPDGIYTAPTDDDLKRDIELSMAMGFNGARPHEKIFEERYLYHCDCAGYLVWGEYPDWGLDHTRAESIYAILPEWIEEVERDFNHPAIIGWCPHNETWDQNGCKQFDASIRMMYEVTKAMDSTRPCIDTSGNYHVKTDIFDLHDYHQDPKVLKEHYESLDTDGTIIDRFKARQTYRGEPVFISEFGGIRWSDQDGWGYGDAPKTGEEFLERFKGLTAALIDNPQIFGFCYTQLTDVEQEQNGLYTYDRKAKFAPEIIHAIVSRKSAIEESR